MATPTNPFYSTSDPSRLIYVHSVSDGRYINMNHKGSEWQRMLTPGLIEQGFTACQVWLKENPHFKEQKKRYSGAGWQENTERARVASLMGCRVGVISCVVVVLLRLSKGDREVSLGGTAGFREMRWGRGWGAGFHWWGEGIGSPRSSGECCRWWSQNYCWASRCFPPSAALLH